MIEPRPCTTCDGDGDCLRCRGDGKDAERDDHICTMCEGSGKCRECDGTGIEGGEGEPEPEPDGVFAEGEDE